jgi:deazaflavin-dependent oxidoreductase (nitroreductase family)
MGRLFLKFFSKVNVLVYRASGGRVGSRFKSAPVLLLATTGRKSGKRRTTPLLYAEDGGRYIVVASVGGAPKHPTWYLNLGADAGATIQVGGRKLDVRAETAAPDERARLWTVMTRMYPPYDDYQAKTSREIPIVILAPANS